MVLPAGLELVLSCWGKQLASIGILVESPSSIKHESLFKTDVKR